MPPFWATLLAWGCVVVGALHGMIGYQFADSQEDWLAAVLIATGLLFYAIMCKPQARAPQRQRGK